jgi:hypothetical protein
VTQGRSGAIFVAAIAAVVSFFGSAGSAAPAATKTISAIDLTKPFGARSGWRFTATQAPDQPNRDEGPIPGIITLCLKRAADRGCDAAMRSMGKAPTPYYDIAWQPRYLSDARVVYPMGRSAPPLLLTQTASEYSAGDGEQARYTQLLTYRRSSDRFEAIFTHITFRNNNQEVRFVEAGLLRGDVVVAEPTENAPFGYWITVNRLTPPYRYRRILRYRSATRYGDNNPLAVIDSEMPNIQQRLGLWRPGRPLPLPAKGCPKPRLVKMELWCS